MNKHTRRPWPRLYAPWAIGMALTLLGTGSPWAATGAVTLTGATLSSAGQLSVQGTAPKDAMVELYDLNGRRLWTGSSGNFAVNLEPGELLGTPCAVRAVSGASEAVLKVAGAPKSCQKAPSCEIVAPIEGAQLQQGAMVRFRAKAKSRDAQAGPLKFQWDFAGGALGVNTSGASPVTVHAKPTSLNPKVRFVMDNARFRVRFSATDALGRRCEDAVTVAVGTPPSGLPAKVPEQAGAQWGAELSGERDDLVVLPFEDWTMQSDSDADFMPSLYNSMSPTIHNLKTVVYRKDRLPVVVQPGEAELSYSAASNPSDPVGLSSINSTSQNWPLNPDITLFSPMRSATVQKSQLWEKNRALPDSEKSPTYKAHFWAAFGSTYPFSPLAEATNPEPDEGYIIGIGEANTKQGSFMPGKAAPYTGNAPQAFNSFNAADNQHAADLLPLSDVDDQGRVNPYPVFRVQARENGQVKASTDAVLTASRDFQCRGCHAKGKIAANPKAPYTAAAFAATPTGQMQKEANLLQTLDRPEFFEAASDSIYDQEHAAALNFSSLHDFYDGEFFLRYMQYGSKDNMYGPTFLTDKVNVDGPIQCTGCHSTAMRAIMFNEGWWTANDFDTTSMEYDPNYTVSMHRFHGELQWNDAKTDIVRDIRGMYVRWDWKTQGRNSKTLFPVLDAQGKPLPMEENCLKCHAGQRETHYRDRMSTAGVTCYDCHGDMLAVGEAFPKDYPNHKDKLGSENLNDYRVGWYDNPDCGSCHVGNGNKGQDKQNGFFSAGVMQRAFDDADLSATTRAINRADPDAARFSAAPLQNYQASFPTDFYHMDGTTETLQTKVDAPVFRYGKDSHGNVPCAACHGAAHAIWPNADPSANDNQAALQLQGHTGTLHECNVCHTADSFRLQGDLDGGTYSGDTKAGILGGPHNLHPVNDPYWFKSSVGDTPNQDGTKYGGWHNNYAKKSGKDGEDQCAACHGADHKGTRLSKTPVDRVFDFSDLDFAKLKAAGFKAKVVKVAAGTEIGCDTCHSIETSCTGSPAGGQCGTGAAVQANAQ
jgi:hypothetical protein